MRLSALRPLTVILLLPIGPLWASEDATRWLDRMSKAVHQLNYVGTFVYMQEGRLESMRIVHGVDEKGERERLVSLSGPNREVIREHGRVTCYLPEKEALVAEHPTVPPGFPINLPSQWQQLQTFYDFQLVGESRVAGMPAHHIAISPRDNLRYGQNYWVAADSGLLLRADIVDASGAVIEQLEFTSLNVTDEVPVSMLLPELDSRVVEIKEANQGTPVEKQTPLHWVVKQLPAGFELELQRQHAVSREGKPIEHLVYSDGLASVSIFIEPNEDKNAASGGSSRRGSVHAYTHHIPNHRITVLGEVPLETVVQIGKSVAPLTP